MVEKYHIYPYITTKLRAIILEDYKDIPVGSEIELVGYKDSELIWRFGDRDYLDIDFEYISPILLPVPDGILPDDVAEYTTEQYFMGCFLHLDMYGLIDKGYATNKVLYGTQSSKGDRTPQDN